MIEPSDIGPRSLWWAYALGGDSVDLEMDEDRSVIFQGEEANLVGSALDMRPGDIKAGDAVKHMPTLDIDLPCVLRESETPGHFHLLIDKPMSWEAYSRLLIVMADVGILEPGYVKASLDRGATFLALKPWKAVEDDI